MSVCDTLFVLNMNTFWNWPIHVNFDSFSSFIRSYPVLFYIYILCSSYFHSHLIIFICCHFRQRTVTYLQIMMCLNDHAKFRKRLEFKGSFFLVCGVLLYVCFLFVCLFVCVCASFFFFYFIFRFAISSNWQLKWAYVPQYISLWGLGELKACICIYFAQAQCGKRIVGSIPIHWIHNSWRNGNEKSQCWGISGLFDSTRAKTFIISVYFIETHTHTHAFEW